MIARVQQAITLTLVAFGLAWAWYFGWTDRPSWALGGAALVIAGYVLFMGLEFVLLRHVHRGDDGIERADVPSLVGAWLGEVMTAPRVFCWRQPFRHRSEPDHLHIDARGRRGLVLIHGFFCNRALWNPWLAQWRRRGVPFVAVDLEPVFGPIEAYAAIVETAVRRVEAATGHAPVIVAHSMGGLAARFWLAIQADVNRVHRIVTIGTPHNGTWLARHAHTRNGREMRMQSPWLIELARREGERARTYGQFTCFYSNCDNIVFPPATATLPGADNRRVPSVAHVQMVYAPAVGEEVDRWLMDSGDGLRT